MGRSSVACALSECVASDNWCILLGSDHMCVMADQANNTSDRSLVGLPKKFSHMNACERPLFIKASTMWFMDKHGSCGDEDVSPFAQEILVYVTALVRGHSSPRPLQCGFCTSMVAVETRM